MSREPMRSALRLLRAASWLAPHDVRSDWLREWEAEVRFAAARHARNGGLTATRRARLLLRCAGSVAHAAWLRWDRWRVEMLMQDLKYVVRTLVKKPGFAAITILTLTLGIGANAAIFSAVYAVLMRPLPFPDPERLVRVFSTGPNAPDAIGSEASPPDFVDWRRSGEAFTELAAFSAGSFALSGDGPAEQVPGASVTGGFFSVLAVSPLLGRTLTLDDDPLGAPNVAVLSYALWARRFGGDPAVVGRSVAIQGAPYRIVGVMPRGFAYPLRSELWVPLRFTERDLTTQRGAHYLDVIGRLEPDVPLERVREQMRAVAAHLAQAYPSTNRNSHISVHEMRTVLVGDVKPALLMILGAVGFVLLIVCVNVANLVLTRAVGRSREMAIRAALGAARTRLIRGVLLESAVLALAGGAGGLLMAIWASRGIAALQQGLGIPLLDDARVDGVVVLFTFAVSAAAALLFGTLPAWHTSSIADVSQRIREDSGTATADHRRHRMRSVLIVAEVALAVVLLVGAGLLLRSFSSMASVELGFNPERVVTFNLSLPASRYPQPQNRAALVDGVIDRLRRQPGVEAAGAIFGLPLTNFGYVISMSTLDGRRLEDDEQDRRSQNVRVVTPDYFRAMGISIVRGRAFTPADRIGAPLTVIVNETAARSIWGETDPLGHEFTLGTRLGQGGANAGGVVVGVARDVRDNGPIERVRPTVYLSHAQFPMPFVSVAVRTTGDPGALTASLAALAAQLDPDLPIFRVRTMEQTVADAVAQPRVYVQLLGLFALTAVVLAAIGIYGVLMHAVTQRTREIGIRVALGAGRRAVVALVVRQAVVLAVAGLAIGLALGAGASRLIEGLLFGIAPTDPATFAAVAGGLLAVALVASYVPARRAARVDPVKALKYE